MANEASNDVLMCLQHSKTGFVPAESASRLDPADTMTSTDFIAGKFFEVQSFTLGMKLADNDKAGASTRTYERWRSAGTAAPADGKQLFYAEPNELTVTRIIDTASPLLVQYCLNLERLTKAVLVKRGRNSTGSLVGFLKLEFTELAIRAVDWDDGEVVKEVCKFNYEKLSVAYNRRKPDGSKLVHLELHVGAAGIMAELASDILMIVAGKKGRLQAEGTTDFAQRASKDLSSDFFAPIFELRKFDFAVGTNASLTYGKKEGEAAEGAAPGPVKPAAAPKAKDPRADIVDIQPVGFTRLFDAASTQLFSALVNCETIPSISIIKRKAAGTKNSGEAYLRFDFKEVLMITLDWKEQADLVEETGTFIYRKLKVSYRPQKADGSLGSINQIDWTMKGPPT